MTYDWKERWPHTEKHWNYVLIFPAPDYIFGLVPEYVKIQGYPIEIQGYRLESEAEPDFYARALRFRYNDSKSPQFSELDEKKFHANHLGGTDPSYSIQIRYNHYHSVVRRKNEFFADAKSCFKRMRKNLPPCDRWKAVFEQDTPKSVVRQAKHTASLEILLPGGPGGPHDCGAPVMAMKDGVSLKK